jgi:hypothetical protein
VWCASGPLAFEPARDSRHYYKTQDEQRIYNNRETSRDTLYAILNDLASTMGGPFNLELQKVRSEIKYLTKDRKGAHKGLEGPNEERKGCTMDLTDQPLWAAICFGHTASSLHVSR